MGSSPIQICLSNAPSSRIPNLTRGLERDLARSGIPVVAIEEKSDLATRGDAIMIGQLAVTFLTSSAAVVLFECLKKYIEKERSLIFRINRNDGQSVEISAKNIDESSIKDIIKTAVGQN